MKLFNAKKVSVVVAAIFGIWGIWPVINVPASTPLPTHKAGMKGTEALKIVLDFQKGTETLLYDAKDWYPVLYVQENLIDMFMRVGEGSVGLATISSVNPEYMDSYARLGRNSEGRILIEYDFLNNGLLIETLKNRLQTNDITLLAPVLTDWFIFVTMHQWEHVKRGHRFGKDVPEEVRLRQESEVWMVLVEKVLLPAAKSGRFTMTKPIEETMGYAGYCYRAANGNANSKYWKSFVRYTLDDESADVESCREQLSRR